MKKIMLSLTVVTVFGVVVSAADSPKLTENGRVTAEVVVAPDAPRPLKFAKAELEKYLGILATNACGEVKVKGEGEQRKVKVFISTLDSQPSTLGAELREDGYVIETDETGVSIVGQNARGALYGTYALLRTYGGMRWLTPEPEGEYFTLKGDVSVPYGRLVRNPCLKVRRISGYTCDFEFYKWLAANGMESSAGLDAFVNADDTRRKDLCDRLEGLAVPAANAGGHVVCELMYGEFNWANGKGERVGRLNKLFKEHPNWFPLVKGKRITTYANPCLQDPALFDHMAKNLLAALRRPHGNDLYSILGNNDTTIWCECEKCKAMDDTSMVSKRGVLANRYWYMVNEIAKRVWKEMPDAKLGGWAYQNFWYPPTKVKPDPRLALVISYNNQCWRHAITDPDCDANKWMLDVYRAWQPFRMKRVENRDEIAAGASPGVLFYPAEDVYVRNLRDCPTFGCDGSYMCLYGLFPRFLNFARKDAPFYGKNWNWYAMWQTVYAASIVTWDRDADVAAALEEANGLYYGAGWTAGMKEFRDWQKRCHADSPCCIGWGTGNTIGDALEIPGSAAAMTDALKRAIAAATASGDERAITNCVRAAEMFDVTWLTSYRTYRAMVREPVAYAQKHPIVLDGVADEKDWKYARRYGDFRAADTNAVFAPSSVKFCFASNALYVAGELVDAIETIASTKGPSPVDAFVSNASDKDSLILSLSKAGLDNAPVTTVVVTPDGKITSGEVAVKKGADRWFFEAKIPLVMKLGETWHLGVTRGVSALACGRYRAEARPLYLLLADHRPEGILCYAPSVTGARWKNPGFACVKKNPTGAPYRWGHWRSEMIPEDWGRDGVSGEIREENGKNFVRIDGGKINQNYDNPGGGDLTLVLRARGNGKAAVRALFYDGGLSRLVACDNPVYELTPEWKTQVFTLKGRGKAKENVTLCFYPFGKDSILELDEVVVVK